MTPWPRDSRPLECPASHTKKLQNSKKKQVGRSSCSATFNHTKRPFASAAAAWNPSGRTLELKLGVRVAKKLRGLLLHVERTLEMSPASVFDVSPTSPRPTHTPAIPTHLSTQISSPPSSSGTEASHSSYTMVMLFFCQRWHWLRYIAAALGKNTKLS